MPDVIPLEDWYPQMADKWTGRSVSRSEREKWVTHHTAGGVGSEPLSYARLVADMHYDRWGVPGGYQALVGADAVVREMCGLDHQGVHSGTRYWNRHGLGLAFQGDFRNSPPSDDMLAAGVDYMSQLWLPQTHHRAVRPSFTHCPGDALIALLPLQLPEENPVSLPVNAQSGKEEIRHVQEMLGVAASGDWDFAAAVSALAQRSGTGDPKGQSGEHVNGRMYTHLLGEFIGRVAPSGASSGHDHDGDYIKNVIVSR